MPKKGRNGQHKNNNKPPATDDNNSNSRQSPHYQNDNQNLPFASTPMSPLSGEESLPLSAQTSPLAQPRQLPTPLPDLPLELRHQPTRSRHHSGTRGGQGESPPPTIEVDHNDPYSHQHDSEMLPALGSSPGALIDFGGMEAQHATVSEPHVDQFGGGYRHDNNDDDTQYFDFQAGRQTHTDALDQESRRQQHCHHEEGEDEYPREVYKSPPFRQANLPEHDEEQAIKEMSPSPLPIPPRVLDPDVGEGGIVQGHTRSPIVPPRNLSHASSHSYSRSPAHSPSSVGPLSPIAVASAASNTFASLSKTIRSYTPTTPLTSPPIISSSNSGVRPPLSVARSSSRTKEPMVGSPIAIPSAAPYPPAVSRPNAQAKFSGGPVSPTTATRLSSTRSTHVRSASYREYEPGTEEEAEEEDYAHGYESPGEALYRRRAQQHASPPRSHASPLPERQPAWKDSVVQGRNVRGVSGVGQTLSGRGGKPQARGDGARYPSAVSNEVDVVVWAKWDHVSEGIGKRLYLILGYTHGLQIWDTTNFKSVAEVFNVNFDPETLVGLGFGEGEVEVVDALVVPSLPARKGGKGKKDAFVEERPVLGILFRSTSPEGHARTIFALYSLKTHVVVGKVKMEGYAERFEANERVVVVSTSSPPSLHVLSLPSLAILYTFQSSSLASFVHLPSTRPSGLSSDNLTYQEPRQPKPVFALHGRLLAFAALSPSSSSSGEKGGADKRRGSSASSSGGSGTGTGVSPASGSGSPFGFALTGLSSNISGLRSQVQGKLPTTQAELGSAALKVGSGVLSGMRFLGGKAVEVAKNQMSKSAPTEPGGLSAASGTDRERKRHSSNLALLSPIESEVGGKKSGGGGVGPSTTYKKVERGSLVRVVDLLGLVSPSSPKGSATSRKAPILVAEFIASRSQTIANLKFAPDGCSILAVPKDGQVTKVFKLHPQFPSSSPSTASSSSTPSAMEEESTGTATHLYDLRRGVSGAVIEGLEVLDDGLLVGVTTRNRTVHIFGTNPGGGRMDVGSHASGKGRNGVLIPQGRVQLHPIVRIHGARIALQPEAEAQREHAALAFTFINSNDSVSFPPSLAPARLSNVPSSPPLPSSSPPSRSPNLNNPSLAGRHPHGQDALLFDALSGTLFLQRITLDSRLKDSRPGTSLSSVSTSLTSGFAAMGIGSVPGMGGAGVLSRSVSSSVSDRSGVSSRAGANVSGRSVGGRGGGEEAMELVASCSVVATWNLQRGKEWKEIRNPVVLEAKVKQRLAGNDEWLAQAELSTFSRASSNASQRSIYLSHQFSFYTLGEDYQGAIRLYRLAPSGTKIDVRKDIPIQAFSSSLPSHAEGGDGFLEEFNSPTSPRGIRGIASSFDEPLASALTHEMEGVGAVGVTEVELPMYPNGVPGKRGLLPSSITAIPVRGIGDGVSRGFGQLRRTIGKRGRKADGGDGIAEEDMAFEFDEEEDGEFMAPRIASLKSESKKRSGSHPPRSLNSSIHTEIDDDVVGQVDEELWGQRGWDDQDQQALDDEEKFQTISKTVPLSPPAVTSSTLGPISLPKVGSSSSLPGAQGSLGKSSGRRKKKRAAARRGNGSGAEE